MNEASTMLVAWWLAPKIRDRFRTHVTW